MSYIEGTMFEIAIPDNEKNTSGKFGKIVDSSFVSEDCSAGMLCVQHSLTNNEGYETAGYKNGNDWNFVAAASGTSGSKSGDSTGIFAFNNYDRNRIVDGNGNVWYVGRNTLGIGLPKGERGDFRELKVGKQYSFGSGNFATKPTSETHKYATIQNGKLVATASVPAGGGEVYFEIIAKQGVTEGASYWGDKYRLKVCRAESTAAAASSASTT